MVIERRRMACMWAVAGWTGACTLVEDQPGIGDSAGTGSADVDDQACVDSFAALLAVGCPPGFAPELEYDGGASTVVLVDDPEAGVGLGVGLLVEFGGQAGADWVGYHVMQKLEVLGGLPRAELPRRTVRLLPHRSHDGRPVLLLVQRRRRSAGV
jgi:hypothetical protein